MHARTEMTTTVNNTKDFYTQVAGALALNLEAKSSLSADYSRGPICMTIVYNRHIQYG